jgi:general secretion pathway protein F/type IV pilus assembly protein PilC
MILNIPFFGKTVEITELGRFSYMTSMLLRSGLPFVQAINLSSRILKNSVITDLFVRAANRVVEGERLSTSLNSSDYKLQKSFVQAVALGEETSELQSILANLSALYFEENKDRLGIFLSLLEPVLMLVVGGAVGFIIASMLLPIFSLNIR